MGKRNICVAVLMLAYTVMHAVPARVSWIKVALAGGDSISVTLWGDESFHYLCTEDGTPVVKADGETYRMAPELRGKYAETWSARLQQRNAARAARRVANLPALAKCRAGAAMSMTGKKKGIVILVNFADQKMDASHGRAVFDNQFNMNGYRLDNHYGSVRDYFYDQSYGQLDVEFDIFGPVTLTRSYSFYGQNSRDGYDKYPGVMIAEACKLVNRSYSVNWKDYDWDGDGEVDQVFCIYAGYGENVSGAASDLIWPHECTLEDEKASGDGTGKIALGGMVIDTYAVSCELRGLTGKNLNAIGTACHEFAHCLGLPDIYDTDYSGGFGMNGWDLMDGGEYNGPNGYGEVPRGFTAYERWFCGWMEPEVLDAPCTVDNMPDLQDAPHAYIIYNKGCRDEYFMLENHQSKGWYKYVNSYTDIHGMMVTHIDYNEKAWTDNAVNTDKNHQRYTLIPADKSYGYYSGTRYSPTRQQMAGDLFPGSKGATRLDNTSHAETGGTLYNRNNDGTFCMNCVIYDIREENGKISFGYTTQDIADGIRDVTGEEGNEEYYTIGGIRVRTPGTRGVYIVRKGDKVLKRSTYH